MALAFIIMLLLVPPLLELGHASVPESWSKVKVRIESMSHMGESSEGMRAVKSVMKAPFREGCVTWGCMLALHRLALVILSAAPFTSTVRLICMEFVCMVAFGIHVAAHPFKEAATNMLQSVFLFLLVMLCGLQLPVTDMQVAAMDFQSSNALLEISGVCLWISAMLMLLPLFVGVLVVPRVIYLRKNSITGMGTKASRQLLSIQHWLLRAQTDVCAFCARRPKPACVV